MSDPSLAIQKAIVARLKADDALTAFVGPRVLDHAPADTTYPFVQIGYFQTVDESAPCVDGAEVFIEIQAWSRVPGQVEAKRIAGAVRAALHEWSPALDAPFAIVGNIEHENTRLQGDGDGITTRAIVNFKALAERL